MAKRKTAIEQLERQADRAADAAHYAERLIAGLGDPSKYVYTGTCIDTGPWSGAHCACGMPIRYVFLILNEETREQKVVGSVCINHFAAYNPALYESLSTAAEELFARLAEERKAAKEA